jgi:hypothetical protein
MVVVSLALAAPARAQQPDEGEAAAAPPLVLGQIPAEARRVEVVDITFGVRDDFFASLEVGPDGVLWAATYEGRAYRSRDGGTTWDEATVVPQRRSLYGFADQSILFGKLRSDNGTYAPMIDLTPGLGQPADGPSRALLRGDLGGGMGGIGDLYLDGRPTYDDGGAIDPLAGEATVASGSGAGVLGIGLSNRAPRLSLFLAIRGRTVPNISLGRLLVSSGGRPTQVRRIQPHPGLPGVVFAATRVGLYRSRDNGTSWERVYAGATSAERGTYGVAFDPDDPNRVYLGTERGMMVSNDGGIAWVKNAAMPDIQVKIMIIDPTDPNWIYAAGYGGLFRSGDRGKTFTFAYYSTQARLNDVQWMDLDPFDRETLYLGTGDGILATRKLRTSRVSDFRPLAPLRNQGLVVPTLGTCSRHRGHLYMITRADLPTINFGANGPESLLAESWDGGETWRELAGNQQQGDVQWMTVDPVDPDVIWVTFSRALAKVVRVPPGRPPSTGPLPDIGGPTMTELIAAAMAYHKVGAGQYQEGLDRLRSRAWLPSQLTLTARAGRYRPGRTVDDQQFADDRFLASVDFSELRIMAFGTWRLPDIVYQHEAVTMQRLRVQAMNDEVRFRVMHTVQRHYGELQRLKARAATVGKRDLYTRAVERVRMEQLEAVVDLMSGGYLSKFSKQRKEKP